MSHPIRHDGRAENRTSSHHSGQALSFDPGNSVRGNRFLPGLVALNAAVSPGLIAAVYVVVCVVRRALGEDPDRMAVPGQVECLDVTRRCLPEAWEQAYFFQRIVGSLQPLPAMDFDQTATSYHLGSQDLLALVRSRSLANRLRSPAHPDFPAQRPPAGRKRTGADRNPANGWFQART